MRNRKPVLASGVPPAYLCACMADARSSAKRLGKWALYGCGCLVILVIMLLLGTGTALCIGARSLAQDDERACQAAIGYARAQVQVQAELGAEIVAECTDSTRGTIPSHAYASGQEVVVQLTSPRGHRKALVTVVKQAGSWVVLGAVLYLAAEEITVGERPSVSVSSGDWDD